MKQPRLPEDFSTSTLRSAARYIDMLDDVVYTVGFDGMTGDNYFPGTQVQDDLRRWADEIDAKLNERS